MIKARIKKVEYIQPENTGITVCRLSYDIKFPKDAVISAALGTVSKAKKKLFQRVFYISRLVRKEILLAADVQYNDIEKYQNLVMKEFYRSL